MDLHINAFKLHFAHRKLYITIHNWILMIKCSKLIFFFKELPSNFQKCLQAQYQTMKTAKQL